MDTGQLQQQLSKLHTELAAARQVDPDVRELLGQIMQDIARLADAPGAAAEAASHASAADRIEAIAVQFEAGHPALAASLRRFVDLLGKAGL
ncbi:MAG: DUF4404 family protein [Gammaproteobacteria bacterium]|nr:DUF4404 family protein [Gammaproteobacteria bacterium]